MNKLKIITNLMSDDNGHIHCDFKLFIDNEELEPSFNTDPYMLLNLFKDPKWIDCQYEKYVYFWTCGCGEPGCAGISECKIIKRNNNIVSVLIPRPISYHVFAENHNNPELYDSGYKKWTTDHKIKFINLDLNEVKLELYRFANECEYIFNNTIIRTWGGQADYSDDENFTPINFGVKFKEKLNDFFKD